MKRKTTVSIEGDAFCINGRPSYEGVSFRGMKIEGLLLNSRMVQGIFDDLNPETAGRWSYPDGPWDANRNTRGFLEAMDQWRQHGLLAFTINLQGGSPYGYSKGQPWHNSAFAADGSLRADYLRRLEMILDKADELGMAAILGYFYFGQSWRLADEAAVIRATENATDWLLEKRYTNVLVEICNETHPSMYGHEILRPGRVGKLVELVQNHSSSRLDTPAGRLLVSVSASGGVIPPEDIVSVSDFVLLHGNSVDAPGGIRRMVDRCRELAGYAAAPILFNEDDHFDFDKDDNNFLAAVSRYASWGYFDYRMEGEGFDEGYQSVPCNWSISSARKRGFFNLLAKMTASTAAEQ